MTTDTPLNFARLLKLRLVVARVGEMDLARWWNTKGQLGPLGASVLRRGFPRTYRFAAARSVFAVARYRSREVFDPPNSVTLWDLPAAIEDGFELNWEGWIDQAPAWEDFFAEIERASPDLEAELYRLDLISDADIEWLATTRRSADMHAVRLRGEFSGTDNDITSLALGSARSDVGRPAIPYLDWGGE